MRESFVCKKRIISPSTRQGVVALCVFSDCESDDGICEDDGFY